MGAMTLEDLRKLREEKRKEMSQRHSGTGRTEVIVGMGTCGIAAGAKKAFGAIVDRIGELGLENVVVKQTGCMGLCASEPTVEVVAPGMPGVVYGNVDEEVGRRIVDSHVVKGELLGEHMFDKPAADIMNLPS
jgi:NADP-reducing hydrogenase subunit HndB